MKKQKHQPQKEVATIELSTNFDKLKTALKAGKLISIIELKNDTITDQYCIERYPKQDKFKTSYCQVGSDRNFHTTFLIADVTGFLL